MRIDACLEAKSRWICVSPTLVVPPGQFATHPIRTSEMVTMPSGSLDGLNRWDRTTGMQNPSVSLHDREETTRRCHRATLRCHLAGISPLSAP